MEGIAIVVTGGGLGIGREVCKVLALEGCKVVVADILFEKTQDIVQELNKKHGKGTAVGIKCNVSNKEEFKKAIQFCSQNFGRFDGIVNNAGIGEQSPFRWYEQVENDKKEEKDLDDFGKIIDIDINAVVTGTYLALQEFRKLGTKNGIVVNIASMGGLIPMLNAPVYAAAKAAVIHFTRSLSSVADGTVVAVCPSLTETRLMQQMKEQTPDGGEGAKKELGGFLTVEDIAEGVRVVVDDVVGGRVRGGGVMRVTYRGGYDYWTPGKRAQKIKPVLSVSAKL